MPNILCHCLRKNRCGFVSYGFALLFAVSQYSYAEDDFRQYLVAANFFSSFILEQPVPMEAFTLPNNSVLPSNNFQGRLVFASKANSNVRIYRDDYGFENKFSRKIERLPAFDFEFVLHGENLIPVKRGAITNQHPHWEYILEPGKVWQEPGDKAYSRVALPFSLQERNANCTHNGVMTFLFESGGSVSNLIYQVVSETCQYFKLDLWGVVEAEYIPTIVVTADEIIARHNAVLEKRLPIKAIEKLADDYPNVDVEQFGGSELIAKEDMTVFGFVIDGVNYVGGCETRYGDYPFCEVLDLPSYSLAKSIFAGVGLMHLEQIYPGSKNELIADHVPECAGSGDWTDVTFENALDMATGNYQSAKDRVDEWSKQLDEQFFFTETHAEKISYGCRAMVRQSKPGSYWVYHTLDTYILGTAMNHFLKQKAGEDADIFNELFSKLWAPLQLSGVTGASLRTYDDIAQPFTGYGLTLHHDDIARIAVAINAEAGPVYEALDVTMLDGAMQRVADERGLSAAQTGFRYNNGFWAKDMGDLLVCETAVWLPFMTGYGGINVVLMPNNTVYYYFSDGGKFSWYNAAKASHSIRPYCE
jgi:hypothetical protein